VYFGSRSDKKEQKETLSAIEMGRQQSMMSLLTKDAVIER
jgi:hypothetical protein